jgi:putative transposase
MTETEQAAIQRSMQRGNPYGDSDWSDQTVRRLHLETTLRPRGRPKILKKGS